MGLLSRWAKEGVVKSGDALRIFCVMPSPDGSENKNARAVAMSACEPTKKP